MYYFFAHQNRVVYNLINQRGKSNRTLQLGGNPIAEKNQLGGDDVNGTTGRACTVVTYVHEQLATVGNFCVTNKDATDGECTTGEDNTWTAQANMGKVIGNENASEWRGGERLAVQSNGGSGDRRNERGKIRTECQGRRVRQSSPKNLERHWLIYVSSHSGDKIMKIPQCKYFSFKAWTSLARYGQFKHLLNPPRSLPSGTWTSVDSSTQRASLVSLSHRSLTNLSSQPRRLYNNLMFGWIKTESRRERTIRYASTREIPRCFITYAI